MAALVCYRPGWRSRLFYRIGVHHRRRGERRSFSEDDYAALVAAAHAQLHAPIILIWDSLNVHRSAAMRRFCEAHPDWLTVVQLPAYAPELNATEGVWAGQTRPGQPARRHPRRARRDRRDRQEPTQAHPVPTRTHRRIPRSDRPGARATTPIARP